MQMQMEFSRARVAPAQLRRGRQYGLPRSVSEADNPWLQADKLRRRDPRRQRNTAECNRHDLDPAQMHPTKKLPS